MVVVVDEIRYFENKNSVDVLGFDMGVCKEELRIPDCIHNKPVTGILANAFYKTNIISVYLPDTITFIGPKAFADCKYLESVQIGQFEQKTVNKSVDISTQAFAGCSELKEVSIFSTLATVGKHAFSDCSNLSFVDIEILHLSEYAFHNCHNISVLCLGENCVLGKNSLNDCSVKTLAAIKNVHFLDGILDFIFKNDICIWCYPNSPILDLVYAGYRIELYHGGNCAC